MKVYSALALLCITWILAGCSKPEPMALRCKKADQVTFRGHFGTHNVDTAFRAPADIQLMQSLFAGERVTLLNKCVPNASLTFWEGHDTLGHLDLVMDAACAQFSYHEGDSVVVIGLAKQAAYAFLQGVVAAKAPRTAMGDLAFMLGKWTQTEPDGAYSLETWEQADGDRLSGWAFTLMGKDTVFQERMSLHSEGNAIYFTAMADPKEGPVRFQMTSLVERHAIFENKLHDYPKMIEYKAVGDSGLHARISGVRDGNYGAKDFPLKKVK